MEDVSIALSSEIGIGTQTSALPTPPISSNNIEINNKVNSQRRIKSRNYNSQTSCNK